VTALSAAIGRVIANERGLQGLTQTELARRLHTTTSHVWQLEHDYRHCLPSVNTLVKIGKVLGCSAWIILMRAETGQL
jgi:transcriptional regulator with XRE-family HTH domain